jgi:antitoxin YefM
MQKITADQFPDYVRTILKNVIENQEPVSVKIDDDSEVVIVDAEDYAGVMETFHLLRNPANAGRLREGIRQHRAGMKKEIDVKTYLD